MSSEIGEECLLDFSPSLPLPALPFLPPSSLPPCAAPVDSLLDECQKQLPPTEYGLVKESRPVLVAKGLVTPTIIAFHTYDQLLAAGLLPGAAAGLKMVYPSAGTFG